MPKTKAKGSAPAPEIAPERDNKKVALYVAGGQVVLTYREQMLVDHLQQLAQAETPVRAENKNALVYPSALLLGVLEGVGAVSKESAEVGRGRPPIGYKITDSGRRLLQQYLAFASGEFEANPHKCRDLLKFWQAQDPARLTAYYANVLMGNPQKHGLIEASATLGNTPNLMPIQDDPDADSSLLDPVAQACTDMIDLIGLGLAPERFMPMPNPHFAGEAKGGAFSIRLNGWDAHNRELIAEYLGTDSPTYLIQWLLQVGAFIALRQLHNETV